MRKTFFLLSLMVLIVSSNLVAEKSKLQAALYSAIVPGTGELYAGSKTSGSISLATEAFLWLGYVGSNKQAAWIADDFKQYALAYAGTDIIDGSDQYYDLLQNYASSTDYNNNVYIYGRYYLNSAGWTEQEYDEFIANNLYVGNEAWNWSDEDKRMHFGDLRQDRNKFKIISQFCIGAMVVNRIVSVVKAIRAAHVYNNKIDTKDKISFNFDYNPVTQSATAYFSKKF